MIDFVKFEIKNPSLNYLLEHPLLDFKRPVEHKTGELTGKYYEAEYQDLKFKIYDSGRVFVSGSLHKYFNEGVHNYNLFTIDDLHETIKDITYKFAFQPKDTWITQMEVGLNLLVSMNPSEIVNSLFMYPYKPYIRVTPDDGYIKKCRMSQVELKGYDKTKQCRLSYNVFRFEMKVFKMQFLDMRDIHARDLSQLTNIGQMRALADLLLMFWDETLINHKIYSPNLKDNRSKLDYLYDFRYWEQLKEGVKRKKFGKNRLSQELRKLKFHQSHISVIYKERLENRMRSTIESILTPIQE